MNPLVGRKLRFGGMFRGIEGIAIHVEVQGRFVHVLLERTAHPVLPDEIDGMRRVVPISVDTSAVEIFVEVGGVKVGGGKLIIDERDLRCTILEGVRELLDGFQITEVDGNMRDYAKKIADAVIVCGDRAGENA